MDRRSFLGKSAAGAAAAVLGTAGMSAAAPPSGKVTARPKASQCSVCGNTVELISESFGQLVCCGRPMKRLLEQTKDTGWEKHVPVIEKSGSAIKVKVGSRPHPMTKAHLIQWIELLAVGKTYRQILKPGQKPEATFNVNAKKITARSYCNLHGLWKG